MTTEQLQSILEVHAKWVAGDNGRQRADLRDVSLQGADLRDAKLQGADLRGAKLQGADLRDAKLQGADLQDADLQDASLRDAHLQDAHLHRAKLRDADLRRADLQGANLRDANLQGTDLRGADLQRANLHRADLRGATLFNEPQRSDALLLYQAASLGIVFDTDGWAVAYRSVSATLHGRQNSTWSQPLGAYEERACAPAGTGTCAPGLHVSSAVCAWHYFGVDPTARLIRVRFRREQLLDCDGEKARISGGVFEEMPWPWLCSPGQGSPGTSQDSQYTIIP